MIPKQIELKPCPFCGGFATIIDTRNIWQRAPQYFATCMRCGVETPRTAGSKRQAASWWNRRTGPTEEGMSDDTEML